MVVRLAPLVVELERCRRPVVVVSHLSTLQVLLAYFRGAPLEDCASFEVPADTVIELQPHNYGWLVSVCVGGAMVLGIVGIAEATRFILPAFSTFPAGVQETVYTFPVTHTADESAL